MPTTTETFFLPTERLREPTRIPAALFNRCRLLLSRSHYEHVFVPIRSMQFLAVIDSSGILFVDSQAYRVQGEDGGRLVLLAWEFRADLRPAALDRPVPIELVHYHPDAGELHRRLIGDFSRAISVLESRRGGDRETRGKRVLPFRATP